MFFIHFTLLNFSLKENLEVFAKNHELTFKVSEIYPHPNLFVLKAETIVNNMVLLKIDGSIDVYDSRTRPICLPSGLPTEKEGIFARYVCIVRIRL